MLVKMLVYVTLAVVLLAAPLCRAEVEFDVGARSKRGPTVGLFAFPRVGRSDPELASVDWDPTAVLPAVDLADDYEDYPIQEIKRQGLVPFPRVGRSGGGAKSELGGAAARYWLMARALQQQQRALQQQMLSQPGLVKRAGGSGANSGMWFGPRLGKRSRSGTASQVGSAEQQQQQLAKGDQL
ncbi:cardio acceleratory peptide 2b [Anopheles ziemanni]|uniref:cardio acceleratory peptide 2b n=1 Tax=Anopheles coustani TaxID=139045 RepID=UPI002658D688|nr:cardio acceleratory peptide 2b [Anopheles coustani]XP_058175546.1 cardio acceleratory peptide 2b [Anopheles ziemanni]